MSPKTQRAVTLNIWNKSGPWPERLRLIRAELERLDADWVGLQEVMRLETELGEGDDPDNNQALEIGEGMGYHVAFAPAQSYGRGLIMGNALLTRGSIMDTRSFLLPSCDSGETRSLLYVLTETPFGAWPVFVTHLNWRLDQASVRLEQVRFIADTVASLCPDDASLPPLVMGDFNAEPGADEIRYLKGLHVCDGRSVRFADVWEYRRDLAPGFTYDPENGFAQHASEPPRRIDYIFVRGPDRYRRGEPERAELAFTEAEERVWPSDHYGVVADFVADSR